MTYQPAQRRAVTFRESDQRRLQGRLRAHHPQADAQDAGLALGVLVGRADRLVDLGNGDVGRLDQVGGSRLVLQPMEPLLSTVSKPFFATKNSFCRHFRDDS